MHTREMRDGGDKERYLDERNNGGEEVQTRTLRNVEWNGIKLDMVGRRKCGGRVKSWTVS